MIKIFAKRGTSEKVAVELGFKYIPKLMDELEHKYGGEWIPVDDVNPVDNEILHFDDRQVYLGFDKNIDRYSKAIDKI